MRRLIREPCPAQLGVVLSRRQAKVDGGSPVSVEWKSFSRLKAYRDLRSSLEAALGWRRRCAYCSDSYGADVEHFWPKERYPERAFAYENLCLICAPCNRRKHARFPLGPSGAPLLLDPFFDDPWDSLFFIPATGWVSPRILALDPAGAPVYMERGKVTLEILGDTINAEQVREGRRRAWLSIVARFQELITGARTADSLLSAFGDIDDYGLAEWLLNREGKETPEVIDLRTSHPDQWLSLRELPRTA